MVATKPWWPRRILLLLVLVATMTRLVSAFKPSPGAYELANFLDGCTRVVALTGAGISTESGIPDYRSPNGSYSRGHKPMLHDQFVSSSYQRSRYWARSMIGYERFSHAKPNEGHLALARMEKELGLLHFTITQNVDGCVCLSWHGNMVWCGLVWSD